MIRRYQNILGTPILRYEDGELMGLLYDLIIHPDHGKIEAVWVKPATLPLSNVILLTSDIREWKNKIYINSENDLNAAEDLIRISELLARQTFVIANRVVNQDGVELGKVTDLEFEDETYYLKRIHSCKSLLGWSWNQRIFSVESINQITPEAIWVNEEGGKKGVEGVVTPAIEL
ncbi:hypothetical protein IPJ72_03665 [Candidatus Peregrinibacteria bacterium]|nr:MAG: hypothetical protein IPJ72_03665 [Candidatus Peregrinibacteria bacterium]